MNINAKKTQGLPTRCIAPVMKYCQGCAYGYCHYPEDVVIYNKPKYLSDFGLKRPPQSW